MPDGRTLFVASTAHSLYAISPETAKWHTSHPREGSLLYAIYGFFAKWHTGNWLLSSNKQVILLQSSGKKPSQTTKGPKKCMPFRRFRLNGIHETLARPAICMPFCNFCKYGIHPSPQKPYHKLRCAPQGQSRPGPLGRFCQALAERARDGVLPASQQLRALRVIHGGVEDGIA